MQPDLLPPTSDAMKLVLEQKYRLLDALLSANNRLDERADRIIQTGSIVIGLMTIANLPVTLPFRVEGLLTAGSIARAILITVSIFAFFAMIIIAHYAFRPVKWLGAGDSNWDRTFTDYLLSDSYYNQILSDLLTSIQSNEALNADKSKWIPRLIWLLVSQIITLIIAWLMSSFVV